MIPFQNKPITRRDMLKCCGVGFAYTALTGLASQNVLAGSTRKSGSLLSARQPHFPAKAKRVIFMFMQGGPSQIDTFDYKPELIKHAGKSIDFTYNETNFKGNLLPPQWKFKQHGKSGMYISELFPHLAKHADELCLLNGMHTDVPAHPQATLFLHTGSVNLVRPSMGSWTFDHLRGEQALAGA